MGFESDVGFCLTEGVGTGVQDDSNNDTIDGYGFTEDNTRTPY